MAAATAACATCRFWDAHDRDNPNFNARCRANPPFLAEDGLSAAWPYTRGSDWCGKWFGLPKAVKPTEDKVTY